jgi:hypothetical protein
VVLTTPDQAFFSDVPQLLSGKEDNPHVYASAGFGPLATFYPPAAEMAAWPTRQAGDAITVGRIHVKWLYPSIALAERSVADHGEGLRGRRPKLDGVVEELGSAVYLTVGDDASRGIVIAPALGPAAWRVILASWPELRAETLIINDKSSRNSAIAVAIRQLGVRRVIVAGGKPGGLERLGRQMPVEVVRVAGRCHEFPLVAKER